MSASQNRASDEDSVIVIGLEELESKRRRQRVGEIVFWILSHIPGALVIWWGVHIHQTKHLVFYKLNRVATGDEAVAFSWGLIGIGIWFLVGSSALFWKRPVWRWPFYIVAGVVFIYGIQQCFFK